MRTKRIRHDSTCSINAGFAKHDINNACDCKPMHTPGPWKVLKCIHNRTQNMIKEANNDGRILAVVDRNDGQDRANAALIAAAPDMLKALKYIASYDLYEHGFRDSYLAHAHEHHINAMAKEAIAKAEGSK